MIEFALIGGVVGVICAPAALVVAILRGHAPWGAAAFAALAVASFFYFDGLLTGHMLDLESNETYCGFGPMASPSLKYSLVPLSNKCMYADGSSKQLVPARTNLIVAASLLIALFSLYRSAHAFQTRESEAQVLETGERPESDPT